MRALDNQVRAQRIYKTHMMQKLGNNNNNAKTDRRSNSKKKMGGGLAATIDHGIKPSGLEVTESVRSSRMKLSESNLGQNTQQTIEN